MAKNKKNIKVRDLNPKKDAKGGGFSPAGGTAPTGGTAPRGGTAPTGGTAPAGGPISNN
jgi:hypothetical protein